jgi:hypothetical protein
MKTSDPDFPPRPAEAWQQIRRGGESNASLEAPGHRRTTMKYSLTRSLLAALAGGAALNLSMLLTFRAIGLGWHDNGILLNSSLQSAKLIAVWKLIAPLPRVVTHPAAMGLGVGAFAVGHAAIYGWLAPGWPAGIAARAWRMALLVWFLSFAFFEFFTPFNMFGEPLPLLGLELCFWIVVALAEGLALATVFEWPLSGTEKIG